MNILLKNKINIFILFIVVLFFGFSLFSGKAVYSAESDAIALRVFPNPEHLSAMSWYQKQNFSGSPQSIQVDGYEAVRDGHSVYVNVANLTGFPLDTLYTNIYLITYNQIADNETTDIFANILKNWKFNSNITDSGFCIEENSKNCVYDDDCSIGDHCNSLKARVIRDTKRLSDLAGMNISLKNYFLKNGNYPKLSAGSYLPGKSLSVWPSWTSTLSSELNSSVPLDPINKIGSCGIPGYAEDTCWNDVLKTFVLTLPDIPSNSLIYGYYTYGGGASYDLCTNFETPYNISPPLASFAGCVQACIDLDGDGYGLAGSSLCPQSSADCNDTPVLGVNIHPGAIEICGDNIDQDCNGSDLACSAACVDSDFDGFDTCDPSNPLDTDGQPADCNDNNLNINPGEVDVCDNIDNNCSGSVDESCDLDNDNYCSCSQVFAFGPTPLNTCTQTDRTNAGTLMNTCDCNDSSGSGGGINPGASEICDGIDNNCILGSDETCDLDGDNYCECSGPTIVVGSNLSGTCSNTNTSNPFWIAQTCDCSDAATNPLWHPAITEPNCNDGLDGDCDGLPDSLDPDCASVPVCGDLICNGTETNITCPGDCPVVPGIVPSFPFVVT